MKKIINVRNIGLILVLVMVSVLIINTKEVKAAGTVTWNGPSSITIRETISNITNPIVASRVYYLGDENWHEIAGGPTATIIYTASDTPINYQITKSTTMSLSSLSFTKAGDYKYKLPADIMRDSNGRNLNRYSVPSGGGSEYNVVVSVRNVVDANNVPTGNFTATLILEACTFNEQTGNYDICSKVSPVSGNLIADRLIETNPAAFGHIELSKTVKGTGADTTKYFPFTVDIDNDVDDNRLYTLDSSGWTYSITGIDSTVTYNGNTINNPTTITVGTPTTIYLKHGQTAIIGRVTSGGKTFNEIPIGVCLPTSSESDIDCSGSHYNIVENEGDYIPSFSMDSGSGFTNGNSTPEAGIKPASRINTVDFVNARESSVITGIVTIVIPYILLVGIGVGGFFTFRAFKKNKEVEKSS